MSQTQVERLLIKDRTSLCFETFRLNTRLGVSAATETHIDANWERDDTTGTTVGNQITESSGIFSFPATGIYKIDFQPYFFDSSGDSRYCAAYIYCTTDNSSYVKRAEANGFIQITSSSYTYVCPRATIVFDVTNTTTHKVQFRVLNESALDLEAQTSRNATFVTFHRLGDT